MKKTLTVILALCMCLTLGLALTGCKDTDTDPAHTYKTEWNYDATHHWHDCQDDGCTDVSSKAEHTASTAVKENEVAATCTTDGSYDSVVYCSVCNKEMSRTPVTVDAGHNHIATVTNATCSDGGYTTWTCSCGDSYTSDTVGALGHNYGEITYTWANDNSTVTATRVCSRNSAHIETETVNTTSVVTQEQDCGLVELTTYTATFTNSAFTVQTKTNIETKSALVHNYGEITYTWADDNSTVTATRVCSHNSAHIETETVNVISSVTQNQSCTTPELTTYTATFANSAFTAQTKANVETKSASALLHNYGDAIYTWAEDNSTVTATRVCRHSSAHIETETVTTTGLVTQEQDCGLVELTTYTATFTNSAFVTQTKTNVETKSALEHNYGEVTYTWADDNSTVTATRVCSRNSAHIETETVATNKTVTQEGSCILPELSTFTATFENSAFLTQTKENVETRSEGGHSWTITYVWAANNSKVVAKATCANDNSHTIEEIVNTSAAVTQKVSCDPYLPEITTYTAVFENALFATQTKDVVTQEDGHIYDNGVCTVCGCTEGLSYTLLSDGTGYSVAKGTATATTVVIPKNYKGLPVKAIEDSGFSSYTTLTSIEIPNTVVEIGNYAFTKCASLTSISIPSSVTKIRRWAFSSCSALTTVNLPSSITSIPCGMFLNCTSLISINIPANVNTIGDKYGGAFGGCSSLTSITVDDGNIYFKSIDGNLYNLSGNTLVAYAVGKQDETFAIPTDVVEIGMDAFYCCTSLVSMNIPNSVTSIGESAFYGCTSLVSVDIPNSVTSIGPYAFSKCIALTSIVIPNSVTTIRYQMFRDCTALERVEIPTSVTSIGYCAFCGCESLTNITIPNGVTLIEMSTFMNCTSLEYIAIPNSVTSIGEHAFYGCTSLTSVDIPDSMTSIGKSAFQGCTSLETIVLPVTVPSMSENSFSGTPKMNVFYKGTEEQFSAITIPTNSYFKTETVYYYVEHSAFVPEDGGNYWIYNSAGEVEIWNGILKAPVYELTLDTAESNSKYASELVEGVAGGTYVFKLPANRTSDIWELHIDTSNDDVYGNNSLGESNYSVKIFDENFNEVDINWIAPDAWVSGSTSELIYEELTGEDVYIMITLVDASDIILWMQ